VKEQGDANEQEGTAMIGIGSGFVIDLHDAGGGEANVMGTKAATLAHLASRGFRVPAGFVITSDACERILAAADDAGGTTTKAQIPADIWAEIRSHIDQLGDCPLAVRSSGLAEDLAHASFAGQYETVLEVEGAEAVAAAIRRCLASASSEQVRAYTGSDRRAPMALLVQRMVPADAAGVAFTANPGHRGHRGAG
jgi:phosphoenolpyruvate synthase/pyruvate phosphate dikinase